MSLIGIKIDGRRFGMRLPCGRCLEVGHDIVDLAARKCEGIWPGLRRETITRQGAQPAHPGLFTFQRAVDVVEPTGPDTMLIFSLG